MASIRVLMKSGEIRNFPHEGRAGGSYTKTVRYEGGFAIIKDEWGQEVAIPAEDIDMVESRPERY